MGLANSIGQRMKNERLPEHFLERGGIVTVSIAGQARYFRTNIDRGAVGVGAAGEMAKVSQVFQPSGRF
jgi:hypothetical protein